MHFHCCLHWVYSFLIVATGICGEEGEPSGNVLLSISDGRRLSLITMLILGEMPQAYPLVGVGAMAYLMIVNTVGAYTLQNIAQRYTSDTHSAVLLSMESVIGYFCGVVLYGDPLPRAC